MVLGSPGALVLGAGVFGLTAALELRGRGWDVGLLDAGPIPHPDASSTDVSKLVRADYGADPFLTDLAVDALAGWERWGRASQQGLYHPDGVLLLRGGPLQEGSFEGDSLRLLRERGFPLEELDGADLSRRFPRWNARAFPHGYLNPRGGWVESERVLSVLVEEARDLGVHVRERTAAVELLGSERVEGARTWDGEEWRADEVVVAMGPWTPLFLSELRRILTPVAQPVIHFLPAEPERFRPPAFPPWAADVSRTGWYGFPAGEDGTVKVAHHGPGWRILPGGGEVPESHVEACRAFLREAIPELAEAPVARTRVCFYCDSPDGYFWIARSPEREGLVVASGGSGHAFKFAPLLGALVADVVERAPAAAGSPFAWRDPSAPAAEAARLRREEPPPLTPA